MTTSRRRPDAGRVKSAALPKGPNGRAICRAGCGREVPPRRRTFCSPECVHRFRLGSDPRYAREQVFARDRGVCARCGLDAEALCRQYRRARKEPATLLAVVLAQAGLGFVASRESGDYWQAHHSVPVVEGGGGMGLENYCTLCTPCHKAETKALAKRLADAKRNTKKT